MKQVKGIIEFGLMGWSAGLLPGTVDLLVRVYRRHFEWFELYLALLLPALVLAVLYLVAGPVIGALLRLFARDTPLSESRVLQGIALSALLLLLYGVGMQVQGARSSTSGGLSLILEIAAAVVILAGGIFYGVRALTRSNAASFADWLRGSLIRRLFRNYVAICTGFILFSFAVDLYEISTLRPESIPSTPPKNAPNVIFVTLDTVRADHLGVYGYHRNTSPNIDSLAKEAVVFSDAVSSTSWTLPAHATMFTGRKISEHGANTNHQWLKGSEETLAEVLGARGYATAGFVGGPYCKAKYGLSQGFQLYLDRLDFFEWNTTYDKFSIRRLIQFLAPEVWRSIFRGDGERTAPEINRDVFRWLDQHSSQPFFLFINYFDAHDPYRLGDEHLAEFTDLRFPYAKIDAVLDDIYYGGPSRYEVQSVDSELLEFMVARYDSEIRFLDGHVRKLIEKLRTTGALENSIVVLTADHGEEFFEHGGVLHRQTLFQEVLSVPLIIYAPGHYSEPGELPGPVGVQDILPTILDLLEIGAPEAVSGKSLVPLILEREQVREQVVSELHGNRALGGIDMWALTEQKWKFIDVEEDRERVFDALFNRKDDPAEQKNLFSEHPEVIERIEEWRAR